MFTHAQIWRGIDLLAAHAQTSPSGLARRAGLDATTFNPSKRVSSDGSKPRWPSTESLTKALSAANLDFESFAALVHGRKGTSALPRLEMAEEQAGDAFSNGGLPRGDQWMLQPFPGMVLSDAYSIRLGNSTLEPVYRKGDCLIISPSTPLEAGDRVIMERADGHISAWTFLSRGGQCVHLQELSGNREERQVELKDISWISRILWVSQ